MMDRAIRIGILSVAHLHAVSYIASLRMIPGVEFIGITDDDEARGLAFVKQQNVRWYPNVDALLSDKPDGVIICAENVYHEPLIRQAAASSVHILCEKPLTTTLEAGRAALDAVKAAGVTLMTAFPMRFSAPLREIKTALTAGALGHIHAINGVNQGQMPKRHRTWFVDPHLAGGGALMDHIVHLADVMRWYTESEAVEVYAQSNRIIHPDEAVETGGLVMITFANGTFASIDCSWSKPLTSYPTWGGLALDVIGEKGVINADAFRQNLTIYSEADGRPISGYWGSDSDHAMIAEFVAAIREGRAPSVTGADGYRATEIVVAAYRSAASGQPIQLPLT
ncbi:MAG: Gfo/Idh/MocA family oxidoreductase [Chloroflexota bacterium]|nr:Gfo/Idh/MocA family oxidoreductase [Chloroflexota bacterium]